MTGMNATSRIASQALRQFSIFASRHQILLPGKLLFKDIAFCYPDAFFFSILVALGCLLIYPFPLHRFRYADLIHLFIPSPSLVFCHTVLSHDFLAAFLHFMFPLTSASVVCSHTSGSDLSILSVSRFCRRYCWPIT